MAWMNYCKKCKAEVPQGESCPYCGSKLTKAGERLSFGEARTVARDWFAWNAALRVALPAMGLMLLVTLVTEGIAKGAGGIVALFADGFFGTLMTLLGALLLGLLLLFALQGRESVHYVLDSKGACAYTYLDHPSALRLYARLLTPKAVEAMQDEALRVEGYTLAGRTELPWAGVRRVRFWPEASVILFYRPKFWQALCVRCPPDVYAEAEALVRKRLKRVPGVKLLPKKK